MALAKVGYVQGVGILCFLLKWPSSPCVLDRKGVLVTQFIFENKWFVTLFCSKTKGPRATFFGVANMFAT